MPYTIQQVHTIIFFVANKQQNAYFSHEDVDMMLDFRQMALFSKLTGRPEANTGYLNPAGGLKQDQWFNDAITPFKAMVNFLYADTPNGVLTLPVDYVRLNSLYTQTSSNVSSDVKYNGVQLLGDDLIPDRLGSQILAPSLSKPCGAWLGINASNQRQIQLYPMQPMAGYYTYLKRPPTPKFNYTLNGRQVVYNPVGSQDLLWNDELQAQIIMATIQDLGLNTNDQSLIQFSEIKQQGGVTK